MPDHYSVELLGLLRQAFERYEVGVVQYRVIAKLHPLPAVQPAIYHPVIVFQRCHVFELLAVGVFTSDHIDGSLSGDDRSQASISTPTGGDLCLSGNLWLFQSTSATCVLRDPIECRA